MSSQWASEKTAESSKSEHLMSKKQTALLAFLTDLGLSIWSYFKLTNYDEYLKAVKPYLSSPDFQIQIYQVLLQTFTFTILIFLTLHIAIYWTYTKEKKWAIKYVRIYSFLAAVSAVLMVFSGLWAGVIPLILYIVIFIQSKKTLQPKE